MSLEQLARQQGILREIQQERVKQDDKWGVQDHDHGVWLAILTEEVGEVAEAMLKLTWKKPANVREELVQVAAVALAWIECMDRKMHYTRDPEHECTDYEIGKLEPGERAECDTDGHYLCQKCKWRKEQESEDKDS